jgi:site-specific DNA recombinase
VREEIIGQQCSELLCRVSFDEEVLAWVRDALRASHADEKRWHEAAIGRLRAECDRLQSRMHAIYVDKLDGKVDAACYNRMPAEWRARYGPALRSRSEARQCRTMLLWWPQPF